LALSGAVLQQLVMLATGFLDSEQLLRNGSRTKVDVRSDLRA
jgi:hypothetical protein